MSTLDRKRQLASLLDSFQSAVEDACTDRVKSSKTHPVTQGRIDDLRAAIIDTITS